MVLSLPVQFTALLPESDFLEGWKTLPTIIKWKIVSLFQQKLFLEVVLRQTRIYSQTQWIGQSRLVHRVLTGGSSVSARQKEIKNSVLIPILEFYQITIYQLESAILYWHATSEQRFGSNGNTALLTSQLVKCYRHIATIQLLTGISDFHHSKTFEQSVLVLGCTQSRKDRDHRYIVILSQKDRTVTVVSLFA